MVHEVKLVWNHFSCVFSVHYIGQVDIRMLPQEINQQFENTQSMLTVLDGLGNNIGVIQVSGKGAWVISW